jgi:hypothetical protein
MDYYSRPGRRSAVFVLRDGSGAKVMEVSGEKRGSAPTSFTKGDAAFEYPLYEVISVGNVVEVVEHRRLEPVFYLVDNPEILRRLGVR